MGVKDIQLKIEEIRKSLRRWEVSFKNKYDRSPTVEDIKERPKVEAYYKKYNMYKKDLLKAHEKSEPSSSRILFPEALNRPSTAPLKREYTEDEAFWLNISSPVIKKDDQDENETGSKKRKLMLAKCDLAERRKRRLLEGPREDGTLAPLGEKVHKSFKKYEKKLAGFIFDKKAGFPRFYFPPEDSSDDEEKDGSSNKDALDTEDEVDTGENTVQDLAAVGENTLQDLASAGENTIEEVKAVNDENAIPILETIESAAEPIDESLLDQVQYKKKPIQKRRTRMTKIRFVDH